MKRKPLYLTFTLVVSLLLSLLLIDSPENADAESKGDSKKSIFKAPAAKRTYWPTRAWRAKKPEDTGMSSKKLQLMEKYAFTRLKPESERKGIRTDGVVIIKNGYLVYEKYAARFTKDTPHITWSDSKSYVNALYGIAVKEKRLKISHPAYRYWPSLKRGDHKKITIDMLLRMSSGLYSNETYEASPLKSTVNAMLFTSGHRDMAAYAARQDLEYRPGTRWEYASPTPNLLMAMLKKTMTAKEYDSYPWKKLFNVLGMKNVTWERDAAGTYVGSSYVFSRPRDMARFGYLFLNDGIWEGKRILPAGWVTYSTTIAPAYYTTRDLADDEKEDATYGALWWLNRDVPEVNKKRLYPDVPEDCFMAMGHWGQFIFVIPSLDMVVVYTGDNRDKSFKENTFLKLIIDSIK